MKKFLLLFSIITIMNTQSEAQTVQYKVLRHVVMFGWDEGTDTVAIRKMVDAFRDLPSKIGQIKSLEWGTNNSPENLNHDLTHCFILTFSSEQDRDAYLVHPAHKAFGDMLKPAPSKITVLDFWVQ